MKKKFGGTWPVSDFLYEAKKLPWKDFPAILRRETGLMEFVCIHGTGHPAKRSIEYLTELAPKGAWDIHGCCGCCAIDNFPDVTFSPKAKTLTAWRPVCGS